MTTTNVKRGNNGDSTSRRSLRASDALDEPRVRARRGRGAREPERIQGLFATADFFPAFGVAPHKGRVFTEEEDRPGSDNVVVISHSLWQRRFGSDPAVVGKSVALDGRPSTVV